MSLQAGCLSCFDSARSDLAPRDRVYLSPRWRVAHAFATQLPGWLVVLPRRHVTVLDELTFVFALLGGDTATQVPEQVRDQIASLLASCASLRALSG
jgi:hypothetical protein